MKNFALIGVAGYVAHRHLRAIKETNNDLLVALDNFDSVGIMDSFFPNASFFVEFERFDRHIEKLRRKNIDLDFISICTPNYLHDSHIRMALRSGANAICEKPLVLNPWNLDALKNIENEYDGKVNTILQLRLHPSIIKLKEKISLASDSKIHDVDLTYLTSRGNWYYTSWKGDISKSGGIASNIGIHFYDMLSWVFGPVKSNIVHLHTHDRAAGFLEFEKARVRWFLSINDKLLPKDIQEKGQRTYRSITVDGKEIEFSDGFFDLHTKSYEKILSGEGFGIEEARQSINIVHQIRNSETLPLQGDFHPLAKFDLSPHPFRNKK
ncbi:Gfo/Idh/MocA family oxidoreductase [Lutimonas saemankumensis]|uniref:Gfo/Idh/MocA family protein n=1 Tax=Lutimonas saemankumensis TaxID=483016 RepID=UPI001CD20BC4|nr:Gfo/Idh/MocA family oxidoreductase [Lutimonas saemankumensis]MCA0931048.1 Gfo/Idh/MocA family oxidoreductase [Lutimonas saemankumensis]